jgi:hypothetical protein
MKPTQLTVPNGTKPIGYARLITERNLSVLPPFRLSFVARGTSQVLRKDGQELRVLPLQHDPGDSDAAHLEFAIKHEGVNLEVLNAYFAARGSAVEDELTQLVQSTPTGVFVRRLWCLYEWLTGRRLRLPDMVMGNYQPLLDPDQYVTLDSGERFKRQRLVDNLLGVRDFCPIVRRTEALVEQERSQLAEAVSQLVKSYSEEAIRRAVNYLYTRETRSSFEIEHEQPSDKRVDRYMALLRSAPDIAQLDERELVRIQNETVEPRFAEGSFRTEQNYVGETIGLTRERVHYLPPRPQEIRALMLGWSATASRLSESKVDPVVHAGLLSFAFVFLHPFIDGNGRMHRLLIHHVLSRRGFTPQGMIFPVSAVIVRKAREYDDCLESFSRPVMSLLDYEMDDEGRVTVDEDTSSLYRFPDLTRMVEDLYRWVADTIATDFRNELDFVVEFQKVQEEVRRIVDLPDRQLRLFVRIAAHNGGKISSSKRSKFDRLTDSEIAAMEEVVQRHLPGLTRAADLG